ncbi:hypothetical protein GB937_009076 [Aspergillus fischeri]|nr:hypothetical protein GB937_009076 [Aspergillus fischeri]
MNNLIVREVRLLHAEALVQADDDTYFFAAHTLTYQVLHAPRTRLRSPAPFIILVPKDIWESKRQQLRDGSNSPRNQLDRAQYLHFRAPLGANNYKTFLYLDADIVLTHPIDSIFSDPGRQKKDNPLNYAKGNVLAQDQLQEKYTMAVSPESGKLDHPYPYLDTEQRNPYFNSGFFVYSPSTEDFEHYISLLEESERLGTTAFPTKIY